MRERSPHRRRTTRIVFQTVALALAVSCGAEEITAIPGTQVRFELGDDTGFFDAPFPIPWRANPDGTLRVADFPNPYANGPVNDLLDALGQSPVGFGTTAAIYLPFDGPLDPDSLPETPDSVRDDSSVYLVDVDPDSPERDQRVPIVTVFRETAQTFSPQNILVVLPRPGFALRPGTLYAAVVTDAVRDAGGGALGSPLALEQLKAGEHPKATHGETVAAAFEHLWSYIGRTGGERDAIRAATVFRTGDPLGELQRLRELVARHPAPLATGVELRDDQPTFCVIEGNVTVPLYQTGERPFTDSGGELAFDAEGNPVVEDEETIRFAISIPKTPMPEHGFPLLLYAAGQGGAYTQFIDRGTLEEQRTTPGRGPALYLAAAGIAALGIEAPLTGPRHPEGETAGFEFFNFNNPLAFRDNPRQAALDYTTLVRLSSTLELGGTLCPDAAPGGAPIVFDGDHLFFWGHSTGATIGSMVLGLEPNIRAGVLSGVGGSWLFNLTIKEEPFVVGELVHALLGFESDDEPDIFDPVLNLSQTLWESSEPMNWARLWSVPPAGGRAKDVLLIEGVVDGYFPPPAVDAIAIAARAEPVAPVVEPGVLDAIALYGGDVVEAPAGRNHPGVAALLVQHLQPEGVDGHHVPFELPAPKYQYRCFFESIIATDAPIVPAPGDDPFADCEGF